MAQKSNMKKIFWINFFNSLFWLSSVATFFYLQRGMNYTEILSLSAIMGLSLLAMELPTGIFADRYGRKMSLLMSSIFFIISMLLYIFARTFLTFAVAFAVMGAAIAFSSGSAEALIYDSLPKFNKLKMRTHVGRYYSAEVLAGIVSPPIASIIAKDLSPIQFKLLIYMTLLSYLIGLLLTLTLKDTKGKNQIPHINFVGDLKYFKRNKKLVTFVFNRSLIASAMLSFMLLWQPRLQQAHVPIGLFGFLLALGSLGIFLVNRNVSNLSKMISPKLLINLSALVPLIGFLFMSYSINPLIVALSYVIIRITASAREPLFSEFINNEIPSSKRATFLSIFSFLTGVITLVIRPLIGFISDIRLSFGFIALSALCLIALIVFPVKDDRVW